MAEGSDVSLFSSKHRCSGTNVFALGVAVGTLYFWTTVHCPLAAALAYVDFFGGSPPGGGGGCRRGGGASPRCCFVGLRTAGGGGAFLVRSGALRAVSRSERAEPWLELARVARSGGVAWRRSSSRPWGAPSLIFRG